MWWPSSTIVCLWLVLVLFFFCRWHHIRCGFLRGHLSDLFYFLSLSHGRVCMCACVHRLGTAAVVTTRARTPPPTSPVSDLQSAMLLIHSSRGYLLLARVPVVSRGPNSRMRLGLQYHRLARFGTLSRCTAHRLSVSAGRSQGRRPSHNGHDRKPQRGRRFGKPSTDKPISRTWIPRPRPHPAHHRPPPPLLKHQGCAAGRLPPPPCSPPRPLAPPPCP